MPVAVAITLLALNGRGYYIGSELAGAKGQDDLKFFGLQLAVKLFEVMSAASLAAVVFYYIRQELIMHDGLPFGALAYPSGLLWPDFNFEI